MAKPLIDADALIAQFENATAQQGEQLRKAVSSATLQALQGRELSLKNIRASLKGVTDAVGAGMAKSGLPAADAEGLLDKGTRDRRRARPESGRQTAGPDDGRPSVR